MIATTRPQMSVNEPTLFVAFELSAKTWHLAMTMGFGIDAWVRPVPARDWERVTAVIAEAKRRFKLAATTRVVSCYEAGRDGFWIHRALSAQAIVNHVIDSSSIEVNRRKRRVKTDRVDARKLVQILVRWYAGERDVWHEVRVPTVADEAARHTSRERAALVAERTALVNQLRGWLTTWGASVPARRGAAWWTTIRDWSGALLPAALQTRLARAEARLALLAEQIATLEAQHRAAAASAPTDSALARLVQVKGVAATGAAVLLEEGLVWRAFRNRRQIGGILGFAPTPYGSGASMHEQGISRAGNARLQAVSIQLAWNWVRWQPDSALTQWYLARFGTGKRARRIGIVALARKLVIALWRYVTTGVLPTGAILKVA